MRTRSIPISIILALMVFFCHRPFCCDVLDAEERPLAKPQGVERLIEIDERLKGGAEAIERAELLSEKAEILLKKAESYQEMFLITMDLFEAIELDPYNEEYKKLLFIVYEKYWKKEDKGKGESPGERKETAGKVRSILEEYNSNKNFAYLVGPYESRDIVVELNEQGIILSPSEDRKTDNILSYSSEYGWFELEGTYSYFELYKIDIDNDGKEEVVLLVSDDKTDSTNIRSVYKYDMKKLVDIFPGIEGEIDRLTTASIQKKYNTSEKGKFRNIEVVFEKKNGKVIFTNRISPLWQEREELGDEDLYCAFLWDKGTIRSVEKK